MGASRQADFEGTGLLSAAVDLLESGPVQGGVYHYRLRVDGLVQVYGFDSVLVVFDALFARSQARASRLLGVEIALTHAAILYGPDRVAAVLARAKALLSSARVELSVEVYCAEAMWHTARERADLAVSTLLSGFAWVDRISGADPGSLYAAAAAVSGRFGRFDLASQMAFRAYANACRRGNEQDIARANFYVIFFSGHAVGHVESLKRPYEQLVAHIEGGNQYVGLLNQQFIVASAAAFELKTGASDLNKVDHLMGLSLELGSADDRGYLHLTHLITGLAQLQRGREDLATKAWYEAEQFKSAAYAASEILRKTLSGALHKRWVAHPIVQVDASQREWLKLSAIQ